MNKAYGLDIKTVSSTPSERWTSCQLPYWHHDPNSESEADKLVRTRAEACAKVYGIPANKIIEYLKPLDQNQFYCQ